MAGPVLPPAGVRTVPIGTTVRIQIDARPVSGQVPCLAGNEVGGDAAWPTLFFSSRIFTARPHDDGDDRGHCAPHGHDDENPPPRVHR